MACRRRDGWEQGVFPGWFCCGCEIYNGYQRPHCKSCGHPPCYSVTAGELLPVIRATSYGLDALYIQPAPPSAVVREGDGTP